MFLDSKKHYQAVNCSCDVQSGPNELVVAVAADVVHVRDVFLLQKSFSWLCKYRKQAIFIWVSLKYKE